MNWIPHPTLSVMVEYPSTPTPPPPPPPPFHLLSHENSCVSWHVTCMDWVTVHIFYWKGWKGLGLGEKSPKLCNSVFLNVFVCLFFSDDKQSTYPAWKSCARNAARWKCWSPVRGPNPAKPRTRPATFSPTWTRTPCPRRPAQASAPSTGPRWGWRGGTWKQTWTSCPPRRKWSSTLGRKTGSLCPRTGTVPVSEVCCSSSAQFINYQVVLGVFCFWFVAILMYFIPCVVVLILLRFA